MFSDFFKSKTKNSSRLVGFLTFQRHIRGLTKTGLASRSVCVKRDPEGSKRTNETGLALEFPDGTFDANVPTTDGLCVGAPQVKREPKALHKRANEDRRLVTTFDLFVV